MKRLQVLVLGFLFLTQPVLAQPMEMSQSEAAKYIQSNTYFNCETDRDCILTGNSCGQLIAINKAEHERYAVASSLMSAEMTCPPVAPQKTSDYEAVCRGDICQALND